MARAAVRIVTDREGGWVQLDPGEQGSLCVVVQGISPPIKTRRARMLRRAGLRAILILSAVWLGTSLAGIALALAVAVGRSG
jgi:hypothetical protein